jgi:hypothetical protein
MSFEMKIALMQPNYLPWRGYFDMINRADFFVYYDDVQYTKKSWRNRNYINGVNGLSRLTVPVHADLSENICSTKIDNSTDWRSRHFNSIRVNYSKTKYYDCYIDEIFQEIYSKKWEYLSELNVKSTDLFCKFLGINTPRFRSSDFGFSGDKSGEKILKFCNHFECDVLINGPAAKDYLSDKMFSDAGVKIEYMNYDYAEYPVQNKVIYSGNCSIVDLIFN